LVALDTTQKLLDRIQTKKIIFKVSKVSDEQLSLDGVQFNIDNPNTISVLYEKNSCKFDDIINCIKSKNIEIIDIATEEGDLEDVFVQLTNN
jgi:ABC-2 type transport system ATP-binding protein